MHHLILASESPRRKELLQKAGFHFTVVPSKVSEIPDENLNVAEQILQIAGRKARASFTLASANQKKPFVVLASDTEVVLDERLLGKPTSPEHAQETLSRLSGRSHEVKTAVWMIESSTGLELSHIETTLVHFRTLTSQEISDYVATGEPMDKAGSYGIQGLGGKLVEKIEGDFNNVVGLPVDAVVKMFRQKNWEFSK